MGVPGEQEFVAVGGELVKQSGLWGMHDADAKVGGRVGLARHLLVAIPLDMGVVHPGQRDVQSADGQPASLIVQVEPAGRGHVIA